MSCRGFAPFAKKSRSFSQSRPRPRERAELPTLDSSTSTSTRDSRNRSGAFRGFISASTGVHRRVGVAARHWTAFSAVRWLGQAGFLFTKLLCFLPGFFVQVTLSLFKLIIGCWQCVCSFKWLLIEEHYSRKRPACR